MQRPVRPVRRLLAGFAALSLLVVAGCGDDGATVREISDDGSGSGSGSGEE